MFIVETENESETLLGQFVDFKYLMAEAPRMRVFTGFQKVELKWTD